MKKEAFDYGQYEKLYNDPRTKRIIKEVDALARKMDVPYAMIGGMASYIRVKNPPDDVPDIDFLLYVDAVDARRFAKALAQRPKFAMRLLDFDKDDNYMFSGFIYDHEIQVECFTSSDKTEPGKTERQSGVELEPVEPLIAEKLIRGTNSDIRVALDLLAYADYDKRVMAQIAQEYRMTGMLQKAAYWARRLAAGKLSEEGINNVVRQIARES